MQTSTIVVLACLLAMVVARAQPELQTADDHLLESVYDSPHSEGGPRDKRGIFLLKKKLILGALGLKAAKVAAGAGVVGALAYKAKKSKSVPTTHYHYGW